MSELSNRPILFAFIVLIVFTISLIVPLASIIVIILGIWTIRRLGLSKLAGIDYTQPFINKWYVLIPVYLIIIGINQLFHIDFSQIGTSNIISLLLGTLGVGFTEEIVFRGILQSNFLKHYHRLKNGTLLGVMLPSVIFGSMHLLNLTESESDTIEVYGQILYAIFLGTYFGAVLLKTQRLLPLIIIHGLINFVFGLATLAENGNQQHPSTLEYLAPILLTFPLFIGGLIIIQKLDLGNQPKIIPPKI